MSVEAAPYVRWWCAREPVLDGRLPREVLREGADPLLDGVYDAAPPDVPPAVLALLDCRTALPTETDDVLDLLDRLGDAERRVGRAQLRSLLVHVSGLPDPGEVEPPRHVRAVAPDGGVVAVPRESAVLVDAPDLLPLLGNRPVVPAPAAAAERLGRWLGVPLASRLASYEVVSQHPLTVRDLDGRAVEVGWRVVGGRSYAEGAEGLGRARAWLAGQWERRHAYVEEARGGTDPMVRLEADLE